MHQTTQKNARNTLKANTYAMYVDGVRVQGGSNYWWTYGNQQGQEPINVNFLFDGGWGYHGSSDPNDNPGMKDKEIPTSELADKYYEWDYSRVYLSGSTPTTGQGSNVLVNPSFDAENYDTQMPSGWGEWSSWGGNGSGYTESYGGSHSGARHYTHWGNTAYNLYTYQIKTGLANGLYTFRVWAKNSGGQQASQIGAKNFGGAEKATAIPVSSSYQLVEVKDINVTNGQCEVYFWSDTQNGGTVYFDDAELFKQAAAATTAAPINHRIGIRANNSGRFVSSDQYWGTYLRSAWATSATGGWETFVVRDAGNGQIALWCDASGKYVSADIFDNGYLQARNLSTIGDWEKFQWVDQGGGNFGLKASINGKFVSANLNDNDRLMANWATSIGTWEAFSYTDLGPA